uniref:NACHT domain-containing protein n=1 Tax=Candidatus Electronema sp. TaxID=2698783 RepID=UPI004055E646
MELLEQIKAAFSWLPTDAGTVLDGWGIAVISAFLGLLIARFRKPNTASIQHDASDWLAKNRRKLLGRFQRELVDRRRSFLLGHTALELDKNLAPNQVSRPYSFLYMTDCTWEQDGVPVANTDQPIVDLFCRPDVGEQLAILGKPGSGKTVCLLTLLEHLLQTAQDNDAAPLPVVFECSEWDGRELSLWMAAQLHRKYQFPEDMARHLVQAHDILPLLDGLDELATEKRGSFVSQFNLFADNRPLVLCCRLEEYRQLRESEGQKLALRNAAILQDITPQRLKGHLLRTGLEDIWTVLEQSRIEAGQPQSLLELAQRPLFLGVMIEVAQDLRQGSGRQPGETWEDFLWRNYLDKQLNVPPPARGKKYSKEQSLHWLRCLAKWMQAEQKVELQIDELQPTMLKSYWRSGLLYLLIYILFFGITGSLFKGPIRDIKIGVLLGVEIGLFFWLFSMRTTFNATLIRYLLIIMPLSCLGVLVSVLVQTQKHEVRQLLMITLFIGLFAVLLDGLLKYMKTVNKRLVKSIHIEKLPTEALRSSLLLFPVLTFMSMIIFVLLMFFIEWTCFAVGLSFDGDSFYLFLFGMIVSSFLVLRINEMLQHYLLRLCLGWEGQLPLRLVSWLEAMQQRKVLQRVGGSYHFLHKQLQEYLAKQIGVAGMLRRTGKTVSLEEMEEAIRKGAQERK